MVLSSLNTSFSSISTASNSTTSNMVQEASQLLPSMAGIIPVAFVIGAGIAILSTVVPNRTA